MSECIIRFNSITYNISGAVKAGYYHDPDFLMMGAKVGNSKRKSNERLKTSIPYHWREEESKA